MTRYFDQGSVVSSLASTSDADGEKRTVTSSFQSSLPDAAIKYTAAIERKVNSVPTSTYREALLRVSEKPPVSYRRSLTDVSPGQDGGGGEGEDGDVGTELDNDGDGVEDILQRILSNARGRRGVGQRGQAASHTS
jgi:hypothetical protein